MIVAEEAMYVPARDGQRAGWLLKQAKPQFHELQLQPIAANVIVAQPNPEDLMIHSALTFDQLANRSTGFRYLSTPDLMWRIQHPSAGQATRRAQILHLHERMTRPLLTLVGIFLVIPLVVRRERMSLVSNIAVCMAVVGCVYASAQGMLIFGNTGLLRPALCAWLPLIGGGALGAWLTPLART
jgi:lipopolysaccharide export system permease protein